MAPRKGFFKPINPQKYNGNPTNIVYRSGWELILMSRFDRDPNILWWKSEETIVKYRSPIDNRIRRYYPDFLIKTINNETIMIEVKPEKQTRPPVLTEGKRKSNKYIREVVTWGINQAKFKAAREYCKDHGYKFQLFTEVELGLKK